MAADKIVTALKIIRGVLSGESSGVCAMGYLAEGLREIVVISSFSLWLPEFKPEKFLGKKIGIIVSLPVILINSKSIL